MYCCISICYYRTFLFFPPFFSQFLVLAHKTTLKASIMKALRRFCAPLLSSASLVSPCRQFKSDDRYGADMASVGHGSTYVRDSAISTAAETVAAGQYAEHKPRAIMFVNHRPVEIIPNEENVLEVLEREGIRVPKFCYHPILSVAGNCRMCMVQVDGTQNLVVACSTVTMPGMSIITDSRLVRDAREGNVELILINHPNDCPICEQATNCDLQNVSMNYGTNIPRYREDKKAVEDFYFDPQTRVVLNRCIHCTRCVRFLNEHAQDFNLGHIGRGGLSEISTFLDELEVKTDNNMPVSQLCPVGSLYLGDAEENNEIIDELEA
ncbi:NADH:ubiquinone oxidoreductase 78 Kd subunit-like protein [Angomonas deanei]|uniref:2Fe-2S iron-sulfur cluster binding domain/NADH-ubiquinone oxidoreductase-G iron-sulfur binding region containing protein, putative n=1 Tax=Angomonas deanei TaxID=59799 RepID=S9WL98_9TRYP|nr:NADH:ubiquinone oxidoreductase 78 Kd subunit-like protein [Angomonas deanei]EPY39901.1 NADH:ubiquinone oxidoreductase 78 Kd subunit-like protein [Angomonas deanei]CAD2222353.1 2Fe-2S iron-sulfur cluster binding domain/NADH-ubiquinone oxidoreductase-G iron-sulfur binding region containing protein, putative [Angomonas deanei]|eukprot:EPY36509.1 NADH:ubiquinone oxidoreductase 78 Kd subunit-like protein [Angomonas deanei]